MTVKNKIKVLVVDDSFLMRKLISDIAGKDDRIEVVGTAVDGRDAIEKVKTLKPDVVTLDIQMPNMDGIKALRRIMASSPVPIIMISAYTKKDADITLECLELGAVDFIEKPSGEISLNIDDLQENIVGKIITAAESNLNLRKSYHAVQKSHVDLFETSNTSQNRIVVIGASTGGPIILEEILQKIDPDLDVPMVIGQHMPEMFVKSFAERLDRISSVKVKEAELGEILKPGIIYLIPGDSHTKVKVLKEVAGEKIAFDFFKEKSDAKVIYPSINELFNSAADIYGDGVLGVVLTGMGDDGSEGAVYIKKKGGTNLAQDKESSLIYGMPGEAVKKDCVDRIMSPRQIAKAINAFGQL